MPKLNYPLRHYAKAVEALALARGLGHVRSVTTKGSIVRFELFEKGASTPMAFWVIYHEHNRKQIVWSREDYRKAATRLNCTIEEFVTALKQAAK